LDITIAITLEILTFNLRELSVLLKM